MDRKCPTDKKNQTTFIMKLMAKEIGESHGIDGWTCGGHKGAAGTEKVEKRCFG